MKGRKSVPTYNDLLFYGSRLSDVISQSENKLRREVEGWERNKILSVSESDLVDYLVEKYKLDAPRLLEDQVYIEDEGETQIDVSGDPDRYIRDPGRPFFIPGTFVIVAFPFEGDGSLFRFQPSTYSLNPPRGQVSESTVFVSFQGTKLHAEKLRQEIDSAKSEIMRQLDHVRNECDGWNRGVSEIAKQFVSFRKHRLLEQANLVSNLGLPLKRRSDQANNVSVPVVRKRRPVVLPPTPTETFKPEPALPDSEYEYILNVTERLSLSIERNPNTFVRMQEEQIRDLILVDLNGHYEGNVTGETFNAGGKTDILIRADGRNVFIAECKFWEGQKALHDAIDQILGYLTWRDTKAALLIFSKNTIFTGVLCKVASAVPQHPHFKQELRQASETQIRYLFRQKDDPARDLYLAVQVFNIPRERTQL